MKASPRRVLARRVVQGLGSQGLSSLGNFALVVAVARSSSPNEFGAFAIVYSIAVLALLALRGAVGETLVVTHQADGVDTRQALGAGVSLGTAVGGAFVLTALLLPTGTLRPWLLLLGVGLPVLALQDAGRYVGFARQQPSIAMASDGTWLTMQLVGWMIVALVDRSGAHALLVAWWLAAGFAALAVARKTGTPAPVGGIRWLVENRRISSSFAAESLLSSGASQAAVYAVGGAAGLAAAGSLRGTQTLYGPVRAISAGIDAVALPEAGSRLQRSGPVPLMSYQRRVAAALVMLGVLTIVVLVAVPVRLGEQLLGETWVVAEDVILPVGIGLLGGLSLTGARIGLRTLHATRAILNVHVVGALLTVGLGVGGAFAGGLLPAAWGLAVAQLMTSAFGWWFTLKEHRNMQAGGRR